MDKKYDVITIGGIPLLYSDIIPKQIPKALHLYTFSKSVYGYRVSPPSLKNCVISKFYLPINDLLIDEYVKETAQHMTLKEYNAFWEKSSRTSYVFGQKHALDAIDQSINRERKNF